MSSRIVVSMLLLALGAAAAAVAGPPAPESAQEKAVAGAAEPAAASGLLVAVDPVTGKLRAPTAAEAKALAAGRSLTLKDGGEGLTEVVWPDGTVTVDLDDSYLVYSVATVDGDGTLTMECLDHPATDLPVATTAVPAPLEEK